MKNENIYPKFWVSTKKETGSKFKTSLFLLSKLSK